ncbi:hypothetical protein [Candidatus Methanoperedens nitratireducens]|uniref:hypothetical protein n=1 Tax=Candidatus Methanoperedens nitratireducens TaxID=1392998 RepID=UPI000BB680B6|nr:hypothetical protein [Candidatus Methanoperedens nitroreducens]
MFVIRGARGVYKAHKPGRASLTAVGDPLCRRVKPSCAAPSRLFNLNVVVAGGTATPEAPAFEAILPSRLCWCHYGSEEGEDCIKTAIFQHFIP